jgi:predicted RNA methylase
MLKDTVRIQAYKTAIFSCVEYFKDKVVMDVGAGTGMFGRNKIIFRANRFITLLSVNNSELGKSQLVEKFPAFNGTQSFITMEHVTGPYPDSVKPSPHPPTLSP